MRISAHTRRRWADLCAGDGTVRTIADLYEAEGILPASEANVEGLGQRRTEVAYHEAALNLDSPTDNLRLLRVYAEGIEEFGRRLSTNLSSGARAVLESLRRDGAEVADDDRVVVPRARPPTVDLPLLDYSRLDRPEVLTAHVERINNNLARDPAAAIGSCKELLESTCRFILSNYDEEERRGEDMQALYNRAADVLDLRAEAVPNSARGSRSARKALRSMVATVQALTELRNEIGLGHGRIEPSPALERHAKLCAHLTRGVVEFLLDTWHVRRAGEIP